MNHKRHAWVIKDDDKTSISYGFYLAYPDVRGWDSRICDAALFTTRKAAIKCRNSFYYTRYDGRRKLDKIVRVEVTVREMK